MSNKKKGKTLTNLFVIVVIIVILGLIGYLVYDLFFKDNMVTDNEIQFKRYTELVLTDETCSTGSIVAKVEDGDIVFIKNNDKLTYDIDNVSYIYKANGNSTECNKFTLFYITTDNKLYLIKNPLSKILNKNKFKADSFIANDFGKNLELLSENINDFVGDTSMVISDTTFYFINVMNSEGSMEKISY